MFMLRLCDRKTSDSDRMRGEIKTRHNPSEAFRLCHGFSLSLSAVRASCWLFDLKKEQNLFVVRFDFFFLCYLHRNFINFYLYIAVLGTHSVCGNRVLFFSFVDPFRSFKCADIRLNQCLRIYCFNFFF